MLRRGFLSSMASASLLSARPRHVRTGIRTATYQAHPIAEAAKRIRAAGFEGVQLGLRFADARLNLNAPDWNYARRSRDVFGEAGVPIFGLDGYVNLVHPDPATRQQNVLGLSNLLDHAREFGTTVVGTEAGSFHPGERGRGRPDDTEAGWKLFMESLRQVVKHAEAAQVTLAFEPTRSTLVGTILEVRRMLEEIGSQNLKIIWDAAHYFDEESANDPGGMLKRMYEAFGSEIVMGHANDYRVNAEGKVEYCDIGDGKLDYATYVSLLEKRGREILLAVEHTREPDVERVKKYLDRFFG